MVPGVLRTSVGYTGGTTPWPTYRDKDANGHGGLGDHYEAVLIEFDPTRVSYLELVDIHFNNHNPTASVRGKNQYNHGAWHHRGTKQQTQLQQAIKAASKARSKKLTTHVAELDRFYFAEEYHQKFSNRALLVGNAAFLGTKSKSTMDCSGGVCAKRVTDL